MTTHEELRQFVQAGLAGGASRDRIREVLDQAGWAAADIRRAVASFADVAFPVPVPRPRPYVSAREAFICLLQFTTLYISAYNLGSLLFQIINYAFPDPAAADVMSLANDHLRWSVASLVVAFPVFVGISRHIRAEETADPAPRRASTGRRWLTYLTLFVASAILLGDVTTLVYSALGGELTVRFVLKALTVGGIAGTAFWYYLSGLRADEYDEHKDET